MGDVRSEDDVSDVEAPRSSPPFCRASNFPIIRMCSRRSNQAASSPTSSPPAPQVGGTTTTTDDERPLERRAVRDRNGRILFYYAPLPRRGAAAAGETAGCRVSLCKSRSTGEILSSSALTVPASVNNSSRFAVPLQVRRRQLDDIRRRLAAVDVDDDDGNSCLCRHCSDEAAVSGTCPGDRINCNRRKSMDDDDDDDDKLDKHRKQRRQRLQQAVSVLQNSTDIGQGVRRGGSVESDSGSRSDRDCSTDGSASVSTDTDHERASFTVSLRL